MVRHQLCTVCGTSREKNDEDFLRLERTITFQQRFERSNAHISSKARLHVIVELMPITMEQPSSRSTKSGAFTVMLADRKYSGIDRSVEVLKGEVSAHSNNPRLLFARTKHKSHLEKRNTDPRIYGRREDSSFAMSCSSLPAYKEERSRDDNENPTQKKRQGVGSTRGMALRDRSISILSYARKPLQLPMQKVSSNVTSREDSKSHQENSKVNTQVFNNLLTDVHNHSFDSCRGQVYDTELERATGNASDKSNAPVVPLKTEGSKIPNQAKVVRGNRVGKPDSAQTNVEPAWQTCFTRDAVSTDNPSIPIVSDSLGTKSLRSRSKLASDNQVAKDTSATLAPWSTLASSKLSRRHSCSSIFRVDNRKCLDNGVDITSNVVDTSLQTHQVNGSESQHERADPIQDCPLLQKFLTDDEEGPLQPQSMTRCQLYNRFLPDRMRKPSQSESTLTLKEPKLGARHREAPPETPNPRGDPLVNLLVVVDKGETPQDTCETSLESPNPLHGRSKSIANYQLFNGFFGGKELDGPIKGESVTGRGVAEDMQEPNILRNRQSRRHSSCSNLPSSLASGRILSQRRQSFDGSAVPRASLRLVKHGEDYATQIQTEVMGELLEDWSGNSTAPSEHSEVPLLSMELLHAL